MAQHSKRQHILEVAGNMFIQHGYSAVTMEAIAEAVPVSKPTLYNHFADKKSLFEAVMNERCQGFFDAIDQVIQQGASVEQSLHTIAQVFLERIFDEDALCMHRLIVAEAINFPELGKLFYTTGPARAHAIVTNYLRDLDRQGMLSIADPDIAAGAFLSMLKGMAHMQCLFGVKPMITEVERKQIIDNAVGLFIRGYKS